MSTEHGTRCPCLECYRELERLNHFHEVVLLYANALSYTGDPEYSTVDGKRVKVESCSR